MSEKIDAVELEKSINEKFGKYKNFEIDEKFQLIRELGTGEIVVLDLNSLGNGHHRLKDASQKELEKISGYFDSSPIADGDNPFIPDVNDSDSGGDDSGEDNPFIPD